MRRELAAVALLALSVGRGRAETRALVAADSYLATTPSVTTDDAADVALSMHLEWRDRDRGAVVDWVDRESLIGGTPRRELHELSWVDRSIEHVAITLGRFRVPGGFWLIADGIEVARQWKTFETSVYGGSRSFTNSRTETMFTRSPQLLPLIGAAVTARGDVQATLSYTHTADTVTLDRGGATTKSRQPEQFVDAELAAQIGDHGFVTGGATLGSRYLVTYPTNAARITDDPRLENVWFGSQSLYALIDWKLGAWRLDGSVAALRTKLGQTTDTMELAAISGSFVEATLHATWRRDREWRVDSRYRSRVWGDFGHAHRAAFSVQWRRGVLDLQASAGVDIHRNVAHAPGYVSSQKLFYKASVGRKTATSEVAIGVAATAALGDEASTGVGDSGDQRAPYTLEARRYAFVRAFVTRGAWFGGVDGEVDLGGYGVRALVQIGCSR